MIQMQGRKESVHGPLVDILVSTYGSTHYCRGEEKDVSDAQYFGIHDSVVVGEMQRSRERTGVMK